MPEGRRRRRLIAAATGGSVVALGGVLLFALTDEPPGTDGLRAIAVHLAATTLGLLLVTQRPANRFGLVVLSTGVVFGVEVADLGVLHYAASGAHVPATLLDVAFAGAWLLQPVIALMWVLTLTCFPDGHFPSVAWRRWVYVTTSVHVVVSIGAFLTAGSGDLPSTVAELPLRVSGPLAPTHLHAVLGLTEAALTFVLPAVGLFALADRVRRSGPVVRQQAKWLLAAVFVFVVVQVAIPASPDPWHGNTVIGQLLLLASPAVAQLAVGIAVFRYHLWEIDAVVSKALVFGLLSAFVSAVVVAVALGAGLLVGGPRSTRVLSALVITLVVVTASSALRRRSEHLVRRVVYGDRPRGYAVLRGLDENLATAHDIGGLVPLIVDAVTRGLSVPWAECRILAEDTGHGPARIMSLDGTAVDATRELGRRTVAALSAAPAARLCASLPEALVGDVLGLFSGRPAAVASLLTGDELVGVIGCGDRPGDAVGEPDLELLALVAHGSAAAVRTRRLEADLRERLLELEHQADELRRSRQRLVTAQDDERRRIERDLHDGAQQQLVALAARLRRATTSPTSPEQLLDMAQQAEDAMFTLQDLARGIYPSVLADRGVTAAIRTHAARIPMAVVVDEHTARSGERFAPDVEAALYFVALEALANAQKHAPSATVTVGLTRDGDVLVLEVLDDGRGFVRTNGDGVGLQNMADRMAAVGGSLVVDSDATGTAVRATLPIGPPAEGQARLGVRR